MTWMLALVVGGAASLSAALVFAWRRGWAKTRHLWWGSGLFSLACLVGIGIIWDTVSDRARDDDGQEEILGERWLRQYLDVQARLLPPEAEHPTWVPTGIFIQSLRFVDSTRVEVAAYLWQKSVAGAPADLEPGFRLPEASEVKTMDSYDHQTARNALKTWYFLATLRVHPDLQDYPFDRQVVSLRMRHSDFGRNVMLIPDVGSYPTLDPKTLPGIEPDLKLENWSMNAAAFSFRETRYPTSFGEEGGLGRRDLPELFYRVHLERNVIGALFTHLLVPVFASLLNFLVLMMCTTRSDRVGLLGFNISNVLRAVASLSFVIIFTQLNLRNQLKAEESTYIEAFYFVLYPALVGVVVNAFLCTRKERAWWVEFEDNLIARLAYWPVILGWVLVRSAGLL